MPDTDRQLVENIVAQVLARLSGRDGVAHAPQPTAIHPPVGTCTGDYSKFPELQRRQHASQQPAPPQNAPPRPATVPAPAQTVKPLAGIITARQLQQAMAGATDNVAILAADARLTPLANDLVRKQPDCIRRLKPGHVDAIVTTPHNDTSQWRWWIDGDCPAVRQWASEQGANFTASSATSKMEALPKVIHQLAGEIDERGLAGGILFVRSAARALCYANRRPALRAVLGVCPQAVEQGVAELGANVLIIEYRHHNGQALRDMIARFTASPPRLSREVFRELAELEK